MYLRPVHTEHDLKIIYEFIQSNPLGVITTGIKSDNYPFLQSSHIPWVLDLPPHTPEGTPSTEENKLLGTLRGHVARANPQAKAMIESVASLPIPTEGGVKLEQEVLILFTSPHQQHYVTPKFYTTTKPSTGKVVPTWNYAAVQVYGTLTLYHDSKSPQTEDFLRKLLNDLTKLAEEDVMGYDGEEGREKAWTVAEAPESYVGLLKKAIVGVEVRIDRVEGKWKMSQELAEGDREGTIKGFKELGTWKGDEIARTVEERARRKDEK
ncbi:hypothetical protein G7Y89_g7842 [Cudoniella acicularis]|uniref:Transcriptional regulator n=1 Tax=Cudoniella acicularis TaxID=354080 RepID=A0A8H4W456_9HELO|nr:hypothetical protein G7Y89_g7842 [Cudoniella acicularis]